MSNNEIKALIDLLDDPDNEVFEIVKQKLLDQGTSVVPFLEKAWESSMNDLLQQRIENLTQSIQFISVKSSLIEWKHALDNDLLTGAYIIAKYQYPDLNFNIIEKQINAIKQDVWLELNENLTALEKVKILNHIIFDVHGFTRNTANFFSPQNSYINHVLDTHKGCPVSLAIIYASIAQNLNISVFGVNLPNNFILAYKDDASTTESFDGNSNAVLFYINPFNKGAVFGKREIDFFIQQQKLQPLKSYYNVCSNVEIIEELIQSLISAYERLGYPEKIKDFNLLLEVLRGN